MRTPFGATDHSGGNEGHLWRMDQNPVLICIAFIRNVVVLFLASNRVY